MKPISSFSNGVVIVSMKLYARALVRSMCELKMYISLSTSKSIAVPPRNKHTIAYCS